ncbi:amidohydrolase family protein [Nanohaloarchaea archaeon H01]|nr:amidohydrolase family protein [Nanohaloarchaea archaeon H01]
MILKNIDFLVTQNKDREVLSDVDLRVVDDKIENIGDLQPREEEDLLDCAEKVVMPGLINAHTHASMSLLRGISDNKELEDWLQDDIFPAEEAMDEDDLKTGAELACIEMLETGTTTFNDMYEGIDRIVEAVESSGIRAVLSRGLFDWDDRGEERFEEAKEAVEKYSDHGLVYPAIAPHAVYSCSKDLLVRAKNYSEGRGVPYHIHVSETEKENRDHRAEHGVSPVKYLDGNKLLDFDVVAAHAVWLSEEDLNLLAEREANVAHNPSANLKLGSGIADVPEMLQEGVNVALGTDGPASNNNFNLFEEMKVAGLVHKLEGPGRIDEQQVLDMATINGAEALGMEDEIGSVETGKKADLLVLELDDPEMRPYHGVKGLISNLVFSYTGHPEKVLANGEVVVENGEVKGLDRDRVLSDSQERSERFERSEK